jgi:hypothetical protein
MANPRSPALLAAVGAPVLGLAAFALLTAAAVAAQRSPENRPAPAAKLAQPAPSTCYTPQQVPATKTLMTSGLPIDPSTPTTKVCAGVKQTVWLGNSVYCLTCGPNIQLSDGSCLKRCNAGYVWQTATRIGGRAQCCKATGPTGPFPDPGKYKAK